jgi:hypothetical protein
MTVAWQVAGLALLAGVLLALAAYILLDFRTSPEKKERMRRMVLSQKGRLGDGIITEATESTIYYTYSVSGVVYTTSQDIAQLNEFLPADPERLVGPVWLKYATENPANSIVVCEQWSGIQNTRPKEKVQ